MKANHILREKSELEAASGSVRSLGLTMPDDINKCWDEWKAFSFITGFGDKKSVVLDMGTCKCRILESLYIKGYRRLYGCDLLPVEWRRRIYPYLYSFRFYDLALSLLGFPPIRLSVRDIQKTGYPSGKFGFIASLSVIEHGVDLAGYFREAHRILKPGGYLITSTDYWPERIDTEGIRPLGLPWRIFDRADIEKAIDIAGSFRLRPTESIDLTCEKPVIEWQGKHYTFLLFVLKKEGSL